MPNAWPPISAVANVVLRSSCLHALFLLLLFLCMPTTAGVPIDAVCKRNICVKV